MKLSGNMIRHFGRQALAIAVMCLSLSACFDPSAAQLLASGKARMEKKEFRAAAIEFKNALQKDSSLAEARFLLGKSLLESGDVMGAQVEFERLRQNGYNNDELVPAMAAVLVFRGELDKLIGEFGNVELKEPKRQAELKSALAAAYGAKGKYDLARAATDAALKADGDNIAAQLTLVQLLLIANDKSGALAQVERALKTHPTSSRAWVSKAEVLQVRGAATSEVMAAYREALRQDKGDVSAHIGILAMLLRQQDFEGAYKQLAELKKAQPNGLQTGYYTALIALQRNDLKLAYETAQQLLRVAPDNPRFLHLAGMIEYERGSYLQAAAHLGKALNGTDSPVAVRALLARAQLRSGDPRKALAAVQPLLDSGTPQPAEVYSVAADALVQTGDSAGAKRMFALSVKNNPNDARGRTALAFAQLSEGQEAEGLGELRAIAANDEGPLADIVLIAAHLRARRFEEASAAIAALEKKMPGKPAPLFFKARLAQLQGREAQAREAYEAVLSRTPLYMPAVSALTAMDAREGKLPQALARYEKVLAADPQNLEAQIGLLGIRMRMGVNAQELLPLFDAAISRFADAPLPRIAKAQFLLDSRDFKGALQVAQEGASRFASNAEFQDLIGQAEMAAGNFNQALQAFNKSASLQPNSVTPLMRVVELHLVREDATAAIAQLRKVLAAFPDFAPAQRALVVQLTGTGRADEAMNFVRDVQRKQSADPIGWLLEGDVNASKSNWSGAVAAYRAALQRAQTSDAAVKLHRSLTSANQTAEAARFEADWLSRHPNDAIFRFHLGDMALARGDLVRAEASYRQVQALSPGNAVVLNNLAWILQKTGRPGALEFGEKALEQAPESVPVMDTLAEIYAANGRLDKAVALQRRAVELDPSQHVHRFHLAQYLFKSNKKDEARIELKKLAALGGGFPEQSEVQKMLTGL